MRRVWYGPGEWLAGRFNARQRRAVAAWLMILFIVLIPIEYPFRSRVSLVWLLSEVALVLAMWGVLSAETPVEEE